MMDLARNTKHKRSTDVFCESSGWLLMFVVKYNADVRKKLKMVDTGVIY